MKKLLLFIFCLTVISQAKAQLQISNGAEIVMTGNALLTLQDINLVNNGVFSQTAGTVMFTGNTNNNISGSQTTQFYNLELAKSGANQVSLLRNIQATNQVSFTSGYIDLNGFNICFLLLQHLLVSLRRAGSVGFPGDMLRSRTH